MSATQFENKVSHWQQQVDSISLLIETNIAVLIKSHDTNTIIQSKNHSNFPSDSVLYNLLNSSIMFDKELNKRYEIKPITAQQTNTELGFIFIEKNVQDTAKFSGILTVLSVFFQHELVVTQSPRHINKANFDQFISYLHRNLMHAIRVKGTLCVFYLEIDDIISLTTDKAYNTKEKNDCLDTLKVQIEKRLQCHFRAEDVVMHLYDNTFAAILVDFDCETHLLALANRQQKVFDDPFAYYGEQVICTTNIGCSFYPQDDDKASTLFSYAEEAGKNAVSNPEVPIAIYNERIGKQLAEDIYIQDYLRTTKFSDALKLKKNNICYLETSELDSVRLTLEIDVPDLGIISSGRLINIALKNNLLYDLWLHLLRSAIEYTQENSNKEQKFKSINLRVEPQQLLNPLFISDLKRELDNSQISPNKINIVINEDVLLDNPEKISEIIQKISALDVLVSLSNIKTYTSRTLIQELPIYRLHIFSDIVNEMPLDDKAEALFDSVITAGKQLSLGIIATGIENKDQCHYLMEKGCLLGAGDLYKNLPLETPHAK